MPATNDMPVRSNQRRDGSSRNPGRRVSTKVVTRMPRGLPATRPTTIPRVSGSLNAERSPSAPPIATPAEKNAKTGTANTVATTPHRSAQCGASPSQTGSGSPRSMRTRARRVGSTGTVNPSSTPATVACTPEAWMSAQVARASGSRIHHARTPRCAATANPASGSSASASHGRLIVSV